LLALSAWSSKGPPIVGYEVKVSRSDYRREILNPNKRALAVSMCHAFYFAVPAKLLTAEEKAYIEPEHFKGEAFVRGKCPERCSKISAQERKWLLGPHRHGGMQQVREESAKLSGNWRRIPEAYGDLACTIKANGWGESKLEEHDEFVPLERRAAAGGPVQEWVVCSTCDGRGYMRKSVVEEEAPTLWIPSDVGLVEIKGGRCFVVRKAPVEEPTSPLGDYGSLVRWASFRPDPRHVEYQAVAA